jgi:hypothetical protein
MFAGLPAAGIGGVFYVLLVLMMPVQELVRTVRGEGSLQRWRFIAGRWALFATVIGAMWAQWLIIDRVMGHETKAIIKGGTGGAMGTTVDSGAKLMQDAGLVSVLVLAGVLFVAYLVKLGVRVYRAA